MQVTTSRGANSPTGTTRSSSASSRWTTSWPSSTKRADSERWTVTSWVSVRRWSTPALWRSTNLYVYDLQYPPREVIWRAQGRIGEHRYNPFSSNCEHFARWCKTGVGYCQQLNNFGKDAAWKVKYRTRPLRSNKLNVGQRGWITKVDGANWKMNGFNVIPGQQHCKARTPRQWDIVLIQVSLVKFWR